MKRGACATLTTMCDQAHQDCSLPLCSAPRVLVNDADTKTTSTTAKVVPPTLGGEQQSSVVWEGTSQLSARRQF